MKKSGAVFRNAAVEAMNYYHILSTLCEMSSHLLKTELLDPRPYQTEKTFKENLLYLEQQATALNQALREHSGQKADVMEQILSYIHANFRESSMSLSSLAWSVNLSERYLSALMTERLGYSYMEYVTRIRMEEAERLLRDSSLSVAEVALQSGYEYTNTFFKAFRRWSGMTPTQYRKSVKNEAGQE